MNKLTNSLCCLIGFVAFTSCISQRSKQKNISLQTEKQVAKKKILFVVTSHDIKGNTGKKTGYYLGEVSHPWEVLVEAGYEIDFVSPKGENPPVDAFDLTDSVNKKFRQDAYYHKKITNSLKPVDVKAQDAVVPFLLEDKLKEHSGIYEKTGPFQSHGVVDGKQITGQNPQSAKAVGQAIYCG